MAGVFNSSNSGRKLSGDSAPLFDESICSSDINTSSISSSLTQRPMILHNDNFNGFQSSGTLLDGILQNLSILNNESLDQKKYCTCSDGIPATSYCSVCKDYLCDKCVSAHNRVKVTRDHPVKRINSLSESPANQNVLPPSTGSLLLGRPAVYGNQFSCDVHVDSILHLYCETCSMPICDKCAVLNHSTGHRIQYLQQTIDGSRTTLGSLIAQSRNKVEAFGQLSSNILTRIKTLDIQAADACAEVKNVFRELSALLEQRERELITSIQQTKHVKFQNLNMKFDELCEQSSKLKKFTENIQRECEFSNGVEIIKAKDHLSAELSIAERFLSKNAYFEDDSIVFIRPDSTIVAMISQLGNVVSHQAPVNLAIARPSRTITDNMSSAAIGQHLSRSGDTSELSLKDHSIFLPHQMLEKQDEIISPMKPIGLEDDKPNISSDLREILGGSQPSQIIRITKPRITFGGMGEKDGQLCRPWGIACDRNGNFVIADRSNNRIQIFSPEGQFLRKFGSAGSQPGQFNRPAGLSVDVHNRIVIADKDNHRIQVFSLEGEYLFLFGERGSKNSQFYYPWDIATDSKGIIAVTDTRNHRIQIFDPNGKFIGKYGFEGILWKHFDSPRGIYFTNNDMNLVVTDFNNHRLVIIQSNLQSARFLGSEGCQPSQFMRPQGVAVDAHGNYVVADSRNNRLQVFSSTGTIFVIIGSTQGNDVEEMDRPSGIAVTPDGGVAVVDFGNNRVLVY